MVREPHSGLRGHQPRDGDVRVPDARRAQGHGQDAAPLRAEPSRAVWPLAADRGPPQAPEQGELPTRCGRQLALRARAVPGDVHGAHDVLGHSLRAGLGDRRRLHPRAGRGPRHRADPHLRDRLRRDLRVHRRRLGLRLEVLAPRVHADLRSAGLVRGFARALRSRCGDHGRVALAHRHSRGAGRDALVCGPAVRGARRLPLRRHGRDVSRPVRPPRGRAGARRRLPHRVRRDAVRALHDVRVHQPHHALRALRDALPRRLARTWLGRRHVGRSAAGSSASSPFCFSCSSGCERRSRACATTSS